MTSSGGIWDGSSCEVCVSLNSNVDHKTPCSECGWYRNNTVGQRYPPHFSALSWKLATKRIRDLCKEFPNLSKERISWNVEGAGENDVSSKRVRVTLIGCQMIDKFKSQDDFPGLEPDDFYNVVPALQGHTDPRSPKFDVETECRRLLSNLQRRKSEIKAWQDRNERKFCRDYDHPDEQRLIENVQLVTGCFRCHAPNPTKTCTKCKYARYCNRQCQAADWKDTNMGSTHKEICNVYCMGTDKSTSNGGPVQCGLFAIGELDKDNFDPEMKKHTAAFLDEICRCNNATREITSLNIAVSWSLGKPCFQAFASFRDDQFEEHTENFALFKSYDSNVFSDNSHIQDMITNGNHGCGDIPDGFREMVIEYLKDFFNEAIDRDIKIRGMVCLRATLWLLEDEYKVRLLTDPNPEDRCSMDAPYGPVVMVPAEKYAGHVMVNGIEDATLRALGNIRLG